MDLKETAVLKSIIYKLKQCENAFFKEAIVKGRKPRARSWKTARYHIMLRGFIPKQHCGSGLKICGIVEQLEELLLIVENYPDSVLSKCMHHADSEFTTWLKNNANVKVPAKRLRFEIKIDFGK